MSKAKFAAAKELIQQKKYAEARSLLKTIDDPLAETWLAQLGDKGKSQSKPWMNYGIVAVITLIPALLIGFFAGRAGNSPIPQTVVITVIPTSEPITPQPTAIAVQPTRDCGAFDWWNQAGGAVVNFMEGLTPLEQSDVNTTDTTIYSTMLEFLMDYQDDFDKVAPPLCAHDVQLKVSLAMLDYVGAYQVLQMTEMGINSDPVSSQEHFERAKQGMSEAADTIATLTGLDTSFMKRE